MTVRQAVSIIVSRNFNSSEVYLVERNPVLKFFGGYYAFTGGTLDTADELIPVENMAENVPYTKQHMVCAVRELFEEAGILLTNGPLIPASELNHHRRRLLNQECSFAEIIASTRQQIDVGKFHYVCRTLTPEFAPVRYDTHFFAVETQLEPEIWPGELVSGGFFGADEVLRQWQRGQLDVVPPVILMLQQIAFSGLADAIPKINRVAQTYHEGRLHTVFWTPAVQMLSLQTKGLLPADYTNTYLIGGRELYVIDPGATESGEQEKLWDYLDEEIRQGKQFLGILLTHHHPDHCGAVSECQRRYQLPVYAHLHTIEQLRGIDFHRELKDRDTLPLGTSPDGRPDWLLTCYHTPGHASGHLIFHENRYEGVIAGDMISTLSSVVIDPVEGNMADYMQSLQVLEKITVGALFPGHGPAVKVGRKAVRHLIEHRRNRENKLIKALSSEAQTVEKLLPIVYDDVPADRYFLARRSLWAGLKKLIEEGRCLEITVAGGSTFRKEG